jgi:ABC-type phosphate/phosphonate transport system substrate-binding protein
MKTNGLTAVILVGLAGLLVLPATAVRAETPLEVVVCYPGGPIRARDAKPAMDSMLRVIEDTGHWPQGTISAHFTSKMDECHQFIEEKDPHFLFGSLGLYLQNRKKLHLIPVALPNIDGRKTDAYRVLALKGKYKNLGDLKGKTLGGTHLKESEFLKRIVFANKIDPAKHFKIKPSRRALRALRKLTKGKLDAVIVNQQQYKSLGSLKFADQLEAVFTSEAIPLIGIVANTSKTSADERARLTQALTSMCTHSKGKELCELFGVEAFAPVDKSAYEKVIRQWEKK